jgi:leucyl/phenylalanyl-tRNA--protein transferase
VGQALDEPDGLLAWGGGLETERLMCAYRSGIFPWYGPDQPILWWSPQQRCILPTAAVHVPRRLAQVMRNRPLRISCDTAFTQVVAGCANSRDDTWITPEMAAAYARLHRAGHAHSIEAWDGDELVGGLYGVALGRVLFGESMFSRKADASKVVLVTLCRVLAYWGYPWMDCQLNNPHLERMGAVEVTREDFVEHLERYAGGGQPAGNWSDGFATALAHLAASD